VAEENSDLTGTRGSIIVQGTWKTLISFIVAVISHSSRSRDKNGFNEISFLNFVKFNLFINFNIRTIDFFVFEYKITFLKIHKIHN